MMFGYITLQLLLLLLVLWLLRRGMKDIYYYIRFACNAKFICSQVPGVIHYISMSFRFRYMHFNFFGASLQPLHLAFVFFVIL